MNLLEHPWLQARRTDGTVGKLSPLQITGSGWSELSSPRPDFRAAAYQLLIGLLQIAYPPQNLGEWRQRYITPPSSDELKAALAPYQQAFLLENNGPAFMQDLTLPNDANQLPVLELLIDAGSSSNLYFNKPDANHGLCESCFAQALFTLQVNAPAGGRGVRTSLRGGGPLTTLLLPEDENATLWQKIWINVLPQDYLDYPAIKEQGLVLPWLVPTRTSDDKSGLDTTPESVHPLQAYWSMPRRIRLDSTTTDQGECSICAAPDVRRIRHYRTRHGGTNYTGAWSHPLTPYYIDPKGEKPPISCKGHQAGRGYRDWLGLVLGNDNHQPDAARVMSHYTAKAGSLKARLWCFGFSMSNMKALCWYDSSLPIHIIEPDIQKRFTKSVKHILDSAEGMASALHKQVKAAWFRRPGDTGSEPMIPQSFWQGSEVFFYQTLEDLAKLDFDSQAELAPVYRQWLLKTRQLTLSLFDNWVLSAPLEDQDMQRVIKARAALAKDLNSGKALKPMWEVVNRFHKEAT